MDNPLGLHSGFETVVQEPAGGSGVLNCTFKLFEWGHADNTVKSQSFHVQHFIRIDFVFCSVAVGIYIPKTTPTGNHVYMLVNQQPFVVYPNLYSCAIQRINSLHFTSISAP